MKQKTVIVAKSKERGGRTKVTACAYSVDAKFIGGGESMACRNEHIESAVEYALISLRSMLSLFGRNIARLVDQFKHVEAGIQLRNCSSKVHRDVWTSIFQRREAICEQRR